MESCLRSVPKRFRNGEGLLQCPAMAWDERMKDFHARRAAARGMGGPERLARRRAVVCSNDFTVLAATSSRVASYKEAELKRLAARRGLPVVYLAEAGGARMPDIMGSAGIASFGHSTYYGTRRRRVPMVTAVLGQAYGLPTWNACLSDFVVMLEGASMAVSGPRVLELATGEKISPEESEGPLLIR